MTAVFEADVIEALIPFVDRTHELGLRFALGATRAQVLGLVMRDGLATALVGTALGFVGAFWLGRAMQGMFEGVPGLDTV